MNSLPTNVWMIVFGELKKVKNLPNMVVGFFFYIF